jgi:hypothetical protein
LFQPILQEKRKGERSREIRSLAEKNGHLYGLIRPAPVWAKMRRKETMKDPGENKTGGKTIGQRIGQLILYLFFLLIFAVMVMAAYRKYAGG